MRWSVVSMILVLAACRTEATTPEPSGATTSEVTELVDGNVVRTVYDPVAGDHYASTIYDPKGRVLFSSILDWAADDADSYVEWALPDGSSGRVGAHPGLLDNGVQPYNLAIAWVYMNVVAALTSAYDRQGCDLPAGKKAVDATNGHCCDVHDCCYQTHGCSSSSWTSTSASAACDKCNQDATYCLTNIHKDGNNHPSFCVAAGTCGCDWGTGGGSARAGSSTSGAPCPANGGSACANAPPEEDPTDWW